MTAARLVAEARVLVEAFEDETVRVRLQRSVIRPLEEAGSGAASVQPYSGRATPEKRLVHLAEAATRQRVEHDAQPALIEAVAALQDLAAALDPSSLATFERLQAKLPASIVVAPDGPYLATNVPALNDWLEVPGALRPQLALCRCGASQLKPLCD